jgi:hypothetical protein
VGSTTVVDLGRHRRTSMGVKRVIVAALFCALLLGASPSPAQAASGLVRIEMGNCYNVDTDQWDQTWSSSGAFTDQGRWTERLLSTTTINGLTRARLRTVLHSSRGTIVIRWYRWQETLATGDLWFHGGWYASWGTGAYIGIKGSGRFSHTVFPFSDCVFWTFQGNISST